MRFPGGIPTDRNGMYCLSCNSDRVARAFRDERTFYLCPSCGVLAERSLVVDDGIVWSVDRAGTYWHESVGVIVVDTEDRILCLMRQIFPFSYAIPAGHLDRGETPVVGAARELKEETGIQLDHDLQLEHLGDFAMPGDSCRRGSDDHFWHLYRYRMGRVPDVVLSDEAAAANWLSLEQLKNLNPVSDALRIIVEKFGTRLLC